MNPVGATTTWPLALGIAVLGTVMATVARFALIPVLGARSPFMMFILGSAFSAWKGGWRAGVIAMIVGAIIVFGFIDPSQGDSAKSILADISRLGMFFTTCGVIVALMSHLQVEKAKLALARGALEEVNRDLENRVLERTESLVQAHGELQTITHAVAHDVRAPLRAIIANSVMLQREYASVLDKDGLQMLERQRQNALRLSDLVDKMLEYTRLSRSVAKVEPVEISRLAKDIAADLKIRYANKSITFDLPGPVTVYADATMMGCVLENLLENSCKYSSSSGTTVTMAIQKEAGGFSITVEDTGLGFDPQFSEQIFEPFQRLGDRPKIEGTGIGLANVRRIMKLHGGSVEASSEGEGCGATFRLWLPQGEAISHSA
ncbi:MAG: hypothetical protein BGO01_13375 [Armatimonadetes bacterium 55-13]|nr:MAG: hypothetical protein BGO01_13375 [Armatimonadetes bacterium 55-13]